MADFPINHAISRARFFLKHAEKCSIDESDAFGCYFEAALIFGRTAIQRLQNEYSHHPDWREWFDSIQSNPAVVFFYTYQDSMLREVPHGVGHSVNFNPIDRAAELYYLDDPNIPATETLRHRLNVVAETIADAQDRFAS